MEKDVSNLYLMSIKYYLSIQKNYCINTEIKICKDDKMRQETLMRAPRLAPPHDGLFEYV